MLKLELPITTSRACDASFSVLVPFSDEGDAVAWAVGEGEGDGEAGGLAVAWAVGEGEGDGEACPVVGEGDGEGDAPGVLVA